MTLRDSTPDNHRNSSSIKYKKDEGWCSKNLLRNYLFIFNFFFIIGGGVVLAVGIWSIFSDNYYISLLSNVSYPLTSYLLIAAGLIGIISAFIGCYGISKKDRCYLLIYIFALLIVFLLEAKGGILAFVYREQAFSDLNSELNETFKNDYGFDSNKTIGIDNLHQQFKCCGAISYEDWRTSNWKIGGFAKNNTVPDSCCITMSKNCGIREHPSNIYRIGCIYKLEKLVKENLAYLAIAGLGLCILQVIGIIFSTCLYVKLKTPDIAHL